MDWRFRKYYLVHFEYHAHDMRVGYLKLIKSVKLHPANLVLYPKSEELRKSVPYIQPQYLVSCKIEDSEALEYELRKAERNDRWSSFIKLSPDIAGQ